MYIYIWYGHVLPFQALAISADTIGSLSIIMFAGIAIIIIMIIMYSYYYLIYNYH